MVEVQKYAVCDFELYADAGDKNPFAVEVTATFMHERGEAIEVPGFFDGDKWVVRFSPSVEDAWWGYSRSELSGLDGAEWRVLCIANENPDVRNGTPIAVDWMAVLTGERSGGKMEKSSVWSGFNTDLLNPFGDKDQPCVVGLRVRGKGSIR